MRLGGVALEHAPGAPRVADRLRVVVAHDRRDVGHRGEDRPCSRPEKPGHEVGLDEAEDDAPVRLHVLAVQEHRLPVRRPAPGTSVAGSWASWFTTRYRASTVGPHHPPQLLRRVRPMGARPVDDHDPFLGHVVERGEEPRQQPVAWKGARSVGDHHRHAIAGPHDVAERRSLDRPEDRLSKSRGLVRGARGRSAARARSRSGGKLHVHPVPAVLQPHTHLRDLSPDGSGGALLDWASAGRFPWPISLRSFSCTRSPARCCATSTPAPGARCGTPGSSASRPPTASPSIPRARPLPPKGRSTRRRDRRASFPRTPCARSTASSWTSCAETSRRGGSPRSPSTSSPTTGARTTASPPPASATSSRR